MHSILSITAIFVTFFVVAFIFQKINFLPHINESNAAKRYYFIDGLRGIAAVCVVCGHIWRVGFSGIQLDNFHLSDIGWLVAAFGVQIFFCITGFLFFDQLIKKKAEFDWERFYIARIRRLAPMFMVTISVCVLLIIFRKWSSLSLLTSVDIYKLLSLYFFGFGGQVNVLGINSSSLTAITWTLPYEWRFYLLFPIVCIALKSNKFKYIVLSVVLLIAILGLKNDTFNLWQYFLIGAISAVANNKITITNSTIKNIIFLCGILVLCFSPFLIKEKYDIYNFIVVSGFFFLLVLSRPTVLSCKPMVYIGEASYSIYLTHSILFVIFSFAVKFSFGVIVITNLGEAVFFYVLSSIIVSVVSLFSFKYIEYIFIRKK
ncbi:acyltransferase [Morganella morganii subsp. morganii]|nr:acyltransferase [Morganella morganii subsp. morganii]